METKSLIDNIMNAPSATQAQQPATQRGELRNEQSSPASQSSATQPATQRAIPKFPASQVRASQSSALQPATQRGELRNELGSQAAQDLALERREHQKLYQREYRKKQKEIKSQLEQTQIKGSEVLMILADGNIQTKALHTEDDYIDLLDGFLESLKAQKYLLSFRIAREFVAG